MDGTYCNPIAPSIWLTPAFKVIAPRSTGVGGAWRPGPGHGFGPARPGAKFRSCRLHNDAGRALLVPGRFGRCMMDMVTIEAKGISVMVDLTVGHLADMAVDVDGRRLRPLHRAPWVGEPHEAFP